MNSFASCTPARRACVLLCLCLVLAPLTASAEEADSLSAAWRHLIESMEKSEAHIRDSEFYDSEQEKARAYLHLSRTLLKALEEQILASDTHPYFRIMDPRIREGGDNPDQRYLFAEIEGGVNYMLRGNLGSAARLEAQIYAGRPWAKDGRSVDYLVFEDVTVADDGSFTIPVVAKKENAGSGSLYNAPQSTTVMVRQIFDQWSDQYPGEVHIDRVGYEGKPKPAPTTAEVAAKIRGVAYTAYQSAANWPNMVRERYTDARPANTVSPLIDTFALGGARGRWMASGHFDIPVGKALLIKAWPTRADYQAIQLTDRWFSSLEYANRVTSLNNSQVHNASDGAIYYVVASDDPGYPNWLDTMGLTRGTFILRYDGVQGDIEESRWPEAQLVDAGALAQLIPDYSQVQVSAEQREETLAARRRHVQKRFGF
ncbi:MAG: hypothetical protein R3E54_11140 [Halioglobus sp.]